MGFESSVVGVAKWYAPWVGTLVIDEADAGLADGGRGRRGALRGRPHRHVHGGRGRRAVPDGARCRRLDRPAPVPRAALSIFPVTGVGEVRPGDDLAALLAEALIPAPSRRARRCRAG